MDRKLLLFGLVCCFFIPIVAQDIIDPLPTLTTSNLTVYKVEDGLPEGCINKALIDHEGRLWCAYCNSSRDTYDKFFYRFDGNQAYEIPWPSEHFSGSLMTEMKGIDSKGSVYGRVLEENIIFEYSPDKKSFFYTEIPDSLGLLKALLKDSSDLTFLYLQSSDHHRVYQYEKGQYSLVFELEETNLGLEKERTHLNAFHFYNGQFWLVSEKEGLIAFNLSNNTTKFYPLPVYEKNQGKIVNFRDYIYDVYVGTQGQILLYIYNADSYFTWDESREVFRVWNPLGKAYIPDKFMANSPFQKDQKGNIIFGLKHRRNQQQKFCLLDNDGQLWDYSKAIVPFSNLGPGKISLPRSIHSADFKVSSLLCFNFGLVAAELREGSGIKNYSVGKRALIELDQGQLLANDAWKKNYLLPTIHGSTNDDLRIGEPINFTLQRQSNYVKDANGIIWMSSRDGGIAKFDPISKEFEVFFPEHKFSRLLLLDAQHFLVLDKQKQLFRYNISTKALVPLRKDQQGIYLPANCNDWILTKSGKVMMATQKGLYELDPHFNELSLISLPKEIQDQQILCLTEDQNQKIWFGTFLSGLFVYAPEENEFISVDQSKGLSNNIVVAIQEDREGYLWAATFNGMNLLDSNGVLLGQLFEEDGLQSNEFNRWSYGKRSNGELFFGTVKGAILIKPDLLKKQLLNPSNQSLHLTEIEYYNSSLAQNVVKDTLLEDLSRITLAADKRYLKIQFSTSNLIRINEQEFEYQIEGHDKAWKALGNRRELILNDIPVGNLTIKIRGRNFRGQFFDNQLEIPVKTKEFFYRTSWFYFILAFIPLSLILFWFWRLRWEKNRLELEVENRTLQIEKDKKLIQQQSEKLIELDNAKNNFFTNISHEFRTPLTLIAGLAKQGILNNKNLSTHELEIISRNSNQILGLINQILDLRRLDEGDYQLSLVHRELLPFLTYLQESYAVLAKQKGIHWSFAVETGEQSVDFDPDKLKMILDNLVSNAIKFTHAGGVISLNVKTLVDQQLQIEVQDNGIGIPEDQHSLIFDRFYQFNPALSYTQGPVMGNSGIGLALCQELVKVLGGNMSLKSELGKGSLFRVVLPSYYPELPKGRLAADYYSKHSSNGMHTVIDQKSNSIGSLQELETSSSNSEKPLVLIIEDNEDILQFIQQMLIKDYQVLVARDGMEGAKIALDEIPDMIISDIMMPKKDGLSLVSELKEDWRTQHIPILLLTAKAGQENRISGLKYGADAYLSKPFEIEELLAHLHNFIALQKSWQERWKKQSPMDQAVPMEDELILAIQQIVEQNLETPDLKVQDICKELGLSRAQLHRKIKALTGQSITQYIRSIRLKKSEELLRNTSLSISEINYKVGFQSPSYFTRIFKEAYGESPSKFRTKSRKNNN